MFFISAEYIFPSQCLIPPIVSWNVLSASSVVNLWPLTIVLATPATVCSCFSNVSIPPFSRMVLSAASRVD